MNKRRLLIGVLVLLILIPIVSVAFFERVNPGYIGVRQPYWGASGIQERDYKPGVHVGITGVHRWHYLPRKTHFLHFVHDVKTHARQDPNIAQVAPPLKIRTRDGNSIDIELSIPYRIKEGEAFKIVKSAQKSDYRDRVKSVVENVLRDRLSNLSPEEVVITERRLQATSAALLVLNEQLADYHVQAEAILIRHISFAQNYEEKLQAKQLLKQKANLDNALSEQADQEKIVQRREKEIEAAAKKLEQEWERDIQTMLSDFQVRIARIQSEAQVVASRTKAEGDKARQISQATGQLAMEQAEALRDQLRNEALNSYGGRILLALRAVDELNIPEVTLNSDDPSVPMILDLGRMTNLLVGEGQEKPQSD